MKKPLTLSVIVFVLLIISALVLRQRPHYSPPPIGQGKYIITLTPTAQQKLISLIQTNNEARNRFDEIKKQADDALNDKPNPIKELQSSSLLKGDDTKTDSLDSAKDANKVYTLAMAYAATGKQTYASKAKEFVVAWAKKNNPSEDPINERLLTPMFMGYDIIRPTLSSDEQEKVSSWLTDTANTLIDNVNSNGPSAINNHNSHLLNIVAMIGYITEDQSFITYATDGFKKQIDQDLNADGSSLDFRQRDALYYHVFTLEPLLTLARIAKINGTDLYSYQSPSGASLSKSVAFLIPYTNGDKTHAEWVNSTVDFDKERADAGEKGFAPGTLFKPVQAYPVFEADAYFEPGMQTLVQQISGISANRYPDFESVYLSALTP